MPDSVAADAGGKTGNDRSDWLILVALMAAAGVVRFWGLDFGLPYTVARPDEARLVNTAVRFGSGDLNPHFFHYGSFYPYLLLILYGIYYVSGLAAGAYASAADFMQEFAVDPTRFYMISRILSAGLGTATVFVAYRAARELFGRETAVLSAFFLALAYLHVRDSHFGTTDVPMTFLIVCSLLFVVRCRTSGKAGDYLVAGVFAGLATSTKYAGAFMVAPMAVAHILNVADAGNRWRAIVADRRILLFGAALAGAFLAGTPYALSDVRLFLSDIQFEMNHLRAGNGDIDLGRGWWYHPGFTLFYGLGWPLLLTSLAGIPLVLRRDFGKGLILLAFPVVYYLYAGHGYTVFVRYMIPVVPFLCILAGLAVACLAQAVTGAARPRARTALATGLALLIVFLPAARAARFDDLMSRKDNRVVAAEWVVANLPAGSSLWQAMPSYAWLQVNPGQAFLEKYVRYEADLTEALRREALGGRISQCVKSLRTSARYPLWTYDSAAVRFEYEAAATGTLPEYIIMRESPLEIDGSMPAVVSRILSEDYVLRKEFVAFDTGATANRYDLQDIFYIPYAGFDRVARPGPNLRIYQRKSGGARAL